MNMLKGKVALVTGASAKRGMGRAIALRLAEEGANIVIVDKYKAPQSLFPGDEGWNGLDTEVEEIKSLGRQALAIVGDISNSKEVDKILVNVLEKFGRIDILVHCAAIRGPVGTPVIELSEKDWRVVLDVNTTGAFLISKAVAKSMVSKGEGGRIVLIASIAGHSGVPGSSAYSVSKWGVVGLVKNMALELAPYNILVNAISPGGIITNLRDNAFAEMAKTEGISIDEVRKRDYEKYSKGVPLGRLGTPNEISDLALFLVSPQSSYITGEEISITGGRVA